MAKVQGLVESRLSKAQSVRYALTALPAFIQSHQAILGEEMLGAQAKDRWQAMPPPLVASAPSEVHQII